MEASDDRRPERTCWAQPARPAVRDRAMNADWVAASVRARAIARRRVGTGTCRDVAAQADLGAALARLDGTAYASRLADGPGLERAQRAIAETVLWQLRVLAGWLPASGTRLLRAAAAGFERSNILDLVRHLDGAPERPPFELGALATAWPRLRVSTSREELVGALRRSPWGDPGDGANLADVLQIVWLRELAAVAAPARPWAATVAALTAARVVLVDRTPPSPRLRKLVRPLIGDAWPSTSEPSALRAALPVQLRVALDGIETADQLWRAEARAVGTVEDEAFALVRTSLPSPSVVLGAVTVLAVDAWRLRASLAVADEGGGTSEVLDAVA